MKKLLLATLVVVAAGLTLGTTPIHHEKLVAHTSSLEPQPALVPARAEPVVVVEEVKQSVPARVPDPVISSIGGMGYILPGNNCVACVEALTGRGQDRNAGSWYATSSTPSVGAIAILRPGQQGAGSIGHVMVVVGIRGNLIEVAHCNYPGRTEFYDTGAYF